MSGDEYLNSCNASGPTVLDGDVRMAVKVVTTTTAVLSVCGCLLIMFSFIAYRELRTKARAMLFHLSIADLIIVLSHVYGLYANYDRYLEHPERIKTSNKDALCVSQASFTTYGTTASLFWSTSIGFFMVLLVFNNWKQERVARIVYVVFCLVCWLLPAVIVICDASLEYFGFLVGAESTICYIINTKESEGISTTGYRVAGFLSYGVWVYLTFILLAVLYSVLLYHAKCKRKKQEENLSRSSGIEMKLLLVPVIFLLLRVWGAVATAIAYFAGKNIRDNFQCSQGAVPVLILGNIGVNAQGVANAILFCLLTKSVRSRLMKTSCKLLHFQSTRDKLAMQLSTTNIEDERLFTETSSSKTASSVGYSTKNYGTVTFINTVHDERLPLSSSKDNLNTT